VAAVAAGRGGPGRPAGRPGWASSGPQEQPGCLAAASAGSVAKLQKKFGPAVRLPTKKLFLKIFFLESLQKA
jgi:hypothetical protein